MGKNDNRRTPKMRQRKSREKKLARDRRWLENPEAARAALAKARMPKNPAPSSSRPSGWSWAGHYYAEIGMGNSPEQGLANTARWVRGQSGSD